MILAEEKPPWLLQWEVKRVNRHTDKVAIVYFDFQRAFDKSSAPKAPDEAKRS